MRLRQCIASITSIFMLMHTELKLPGAHNYYMFGTDVETWFSIIREASVLAATQYVSPGVIFR